MSLMKMPIFAWMGFVTQLILVFAIPVISVALFLLTFDRLFGANFFNVSAGGDPLLYPRIVDLVAEIRRRGLKPIINTNGVALTEELLGDLKRAGAFGFTFHVDSRQGRPEWRGRLGGDPDVYLLLPDYVNTGINLREGMLHIKGLVEPH